VFEAAAEQWQPQLLRQLHRVLLGMPAVRSLVHISDGLSSLLLAPVRPAPLRGLRHGGSAFGRAVVVEGLSLTATALGYAQALFEQIHQVMEDSPPHDPRAATIPTMPTGASRSRTPDSTSGHRAARSPGDRVV